MPLKYLLWVRLNSLFLWQSCSTCSIRVKVWDTSTLAITCMRAWLGLQTRELYAQCVTLGRCHYMLEKGCTVLFCIMGSPFTFVWPLFQTKIMFLGLCFFLQVANKRGNTGSWGAQGSSLFTVKAHSSRWTNHPR